VARARYKKKQEAQLSLTTRAMLTQASNDFATNSVAFILNMQIITRLSVSQHTQNAEVQMSNLARFQSSTF